MTLEHEPTNLVEYLVACLHEARARNRLEFRWLLSCLRLRAVILSLPVKTRLYARTFGSDFYAWRNALSTGGQARSVPPCSWISRLGEMPVARL